jgi:beta-alanine degradation protein BauB
MSPVEPLPLPRVRAVRFGRQRCALAALIVTVVAVMAWPASSQQNDDVLKVIPENYKLLLENAFVRVIEARVPPGTVEPPHRHMRGVSVCMTEYTIESRAVPDGEWVRSERKLGTVYWSEGSLHQLRNVGNTQSHTIRIELKY